jgi:cytoskeletal protein RodZ
MSAHETSATEPDARETFAHEPGYAAAPAQPALTTRDEASRSTRQFTTGNDHLRRLREASTNDLPAFAREAEPHERRFGVSVYLGAAIVLVFGALVYIAWRGQQVWSSNPHVHPNTAPSVATYAGSSEAPNLQQPQPPATIPTQPAANVPANATANAAKNGNNAPAIPNSSAPNAVTSNAATSNATPRQTVSHANSAPAQETQPAAESLQSAALHEPAMAAGGTSTNPLGGPGDGLQELETAKGYLNGVQGGVRDSNMAAKWLWKSVAKKNTEATVLLSDLYLKGDGVQHDCDQARLLLDAAAIKHSAAAAERLRNLQAYGCR